MTTILDSIREMAAEADPLLPGERVLLINPVDYARLLDEMTAVAKRRPTALSSVCGCTIRTSEDMCPLTLLIKVKELHITDTSHVSFDE